MTLHMLATSGGKTIVFAYAAFFLIVQVENFGGMPGWSSRNPSDSSPCGWTPTCWNGSGASAATRPGSTPSCARTWTPKNPKAWIARKSEGVARGFDSPAALSLFHENDCGRQSMRSSQQSRHRSGHRARLAPAPPASPVANPLASDVRGFCILRRIRRPRRAALFFDHHGFPLYVGIFMTGLNQRAVKNPDSSALSLLLFDN